MLGYAATTDVKNVPIVVVDGDRQPRSRQLIERFDRVAVLRHRRRGDVRQRTSTASRRGRAWLAIVIPAGLRRRARARTAPAAPDGAGARRRHRREFVRRRARVCGGLVGEFNRELLTADARPRPPADRRRASASGSTRELESRDFMVPGVLALLLLVITANLSSMAIVRERELGTLEQLNVTPLGRWELILGKLLPYALVGFVDVAARRRGRRVLVRGAAARQRRRCCSRRASSTCSARSGLGLFVSTISATQQQAMMTATFFFLMPMIYLSGFIFPIENMPAVIQWVTDAHSAAVFPGDRARHLPEGRRVRRAVAAVRGAAGVGLVVVWPGGGAVAQALA